VSLSISTGRLVAMKSVAPLVSMPSLVAISWSWLLPSTLLICSGVIVWLSPVPTQLANSSPAPPFWNLVERPLMPPLLLRKSFRAGALSPATADTTPPMRSSRRAMKKDVQPGCLGQPTHPIGAGALGWLLGEQGMGWGWRQGPWG
jgi:hypothetical protein